MMRRAVTLHTKAQLPGGFAAAGIHCGIKRDGHDLGILIADAATRANALFTDNALLGAHIPVCRDHLARSRGLVRAVIVNSGNANCATGREGIDDAHRTCTTAAERIGCPVEQVLCMSTGVIGARLPIDRLLDAIPDLVDAARRRAPRTSPEPSSPPTRTPSTHMRTAAGPAACTGSPRAPA